MSGTLRNQWIESGHDAQRILEAFATFPVFPLYLRYAVIDVDCRLFVDDLISPESWMLFAPPAVLFHGKAKTELIPSTRQHVLTGSWILSPSEEWDELLHKAFPEDLQSHPRMQFDAKNLDLDKIRRVRTPLPEELKIEPIGPNHLDNDIMKHEILDRFFQKRAFPDSGFGFALTDCSGTLHGFALTNYPLDGGNCVEVSFRVGTNQDERYRGKGIATTLVSHFLEEAICRGYVPMWDAANAISQHIAHKFGYTDHLLWHMHHLVHPSE